MHKLKYIFIVSLLVSVVNAQSNIVWLNPCKDVNMVVYGLAWFEQNGHKFIRLPLSEKKNVNETAWLMSLCPSSARIRFKTDSTSLRLKIHHGMIGTGSMPMYEVSAVNGVSMYHMSSVAVSGIDLYIGSPGQMSYWKTVKPQDPNKEYEYLYFEKLPSMMREFTLYLPCYAELAELQIGIDSDAKILKPTEYKIKKPIVFYGTSITQGGCASRGSNGFVSVIERKLNCDVVNLGFSAGGLGELAMAQIISQIDASVYVVDSVANMNINLMNERYEKFVRILRKNRPQTPVLLMTQIHYSGELLPEQAAEYKRHNEPVFDTYNKLRAEGDKKVFLFDSGEIIPVGGDHPSVDGTHLTDRGFYMIAEGLEPKLKEILVNTCGAAAEASAVEHL
ncbi:MAG: SGNH/GDSL hydrolase family protein [Phycisphaerae bacterium]|jgi:lysophospholipase L1-like esterase